MSQKNVANLWRQPQKARDQIGEGGRSISVLLAKAPVSVGRAKYLEVFMLALYYIYFTSIETVALACSHSI